MELPPAVGKLTPSLLVRHQMPSLHARWVSAQKAQRRDHRVMGGCRILLTDWISHREHDGPHLDGEAGCRAPKCNQSATRTEPYRFVLRRRAPGRGLPVLTEGGRPPPPLEGGRSPRALPPRRGAPGGAKAPWEKGERAPLEPKSRVAFSRVFSFTARTARARATSIDGPTRDRAGRSDPRRGADR